MVPIQPKELEIDGKVYTLSKFPAVAGREIVALYPLSGLPKLGDYKVNEETMLKLMAHVYIRLGEALQPLNNRTLIDNHVPSWEALAQLEMAMMEYNCSFFQNARLSTFLGDIAQKLPEWISKTLTALSAQSSQTSKQPFES